MKIYFLFFFILTANLLYAQQKIAQKPAYVIIVNNEIVSKEKVDELAKQGYIKEISKGVSDEEKAKLTEKFGGKIGGKEFVIIVSLYTEKEKKEKEKQIKTKPVSNDTSAVDEGYILNTNDTAKNFTVKMIDGKDIRLSDLKGKVVLLNFWATWCAPCLLEFYDIPSQIIERFKSSEFFFLPISIGESKDKVVKKMLSLKKDGIGFNVGTDADKTIWSQYADQSIPKNFLIDQNGIIRYVSTGNTEGNLDNLAKEIKKLLGH